MKHPGYRALAMGCCLCVLYVGYELARACSLALFAARPVGVNGAYTAAGGFILSVATLALYGRGVEVLGANQTLVVSAAGCCLTFVMFAVGLASYDDNDAIPYTFVASLFAFRECYVSVIGTQVWALLSAELKGRGHDTSRRWFCLIQGVSCIASAFSGMGAGRLAAAGGQFFLLLAAAASLGVIALTTVLISTDTFNSSAGGGSGAWISTEARKGKREAGGLLRVLTSSVSLFRRSPLLAALLAEAVLCQVLTAIMNMSFNEAIRHSLATTSAADEGARATGFIGKSFAFVGLASGALQLVVMPWAMVRVDPSLLLLGLPFVTAVACLVTMVSPGFRTATAAFAVAKILDYSVRGTALELVYQPMPDHERLLGKEAIATVGVRVGRTAAHMTLYSWSAMLGGAAPQRTLMGLALMASGLWAVTLRRVGVLSSVSARGDGSCGAKIPPKAFGDSAGVIEKYSKVRVRSNGFRNGGTGGSSDKGVGATHRRGVAGQADGAACSNGAKMGSGAAVMAADVGKAR